MSMLSSILFASIASARMKGRDGLRISQLHQIDLAVQLYMTSNNRAPDLQGTCPSSATPDNSTVTNCVANATTNSTAWDRFKSDIQPYMKTVPSDPCIANSSCISGASGYTLGYTYVAPAAVKYQCAEDSGGTCPQTSTVLNQYYQLYAPLERQNMPTGVKSLGSAFFTPPSPGGYGF